jgi:hypothetical protein
MPKETVKRQGMQHTDTPRVARAIGLVLLLSRGAAAAEATLCFERVPDSRVPADVGL